jgi:hypothetical protein
MTILMMIFRSYPHPPFTSPQMLNSKFEKYTISLRSIRLYGNMYNVYYNIHRHESQ